MQLHSVMAAMESSFSITRPRRQQAEDRASLVTLQQQIGMLPPVRLTMTNYEEMKKSNQQWYSPPFYTHSGGYKMRLNVVANGCGAGKGTYVSVYAYLMRGEFDDLTLTFDQFTCHYILSCDLSFVSETKLHPFPW